MLENQMQLFSILDTVLSRRSVSRLWELRWHWKYLVWSENRQLWWNTVRSFFFFYLIFRNSDLIKSRIAAGVEVYTLHDASGRNSCYSVQNSPTYWEEWSPLLYFHSRQFTPYIHLHSCTHFILISFSHKYVKYVRRTDFYSIYFITII